MHDLSGNASFYDNVHRVFLGNSIELEVKQDRALILIGSTNPDEPKDRIIFSRPAIVQSMMILAQVIEERGNQDSAPTKRAASPKRWIVCPDCSGRGGIENNYGTWHECVICEGAGTCLAR